MLAFYPEGGGSVRVGSVWVGWLCHPIVAWEPLWGKGFRLKRPQPVLWGDRACLGSAGPHAVASGRLWGGHGPVPGLGPAESREGRVLGEVDPCLH